MAKKKKPHEQEDLLGPAPEPTLLQKAGRGIVSGISAAANLLDLPGSSVRDTIAGVSTGNWSKYNPLDQWLTPFQSDNRATGRDLNRSFGLSGRKDTWGNWGGGIATEIATDPLTYLTFGGSALGKFGKVAKAAGIHGDTAAGIYAKAMGKPLGSFGKREARLGLTGDMIKQADPTAYTKLAETAERSGFDLAGNMDQPLGGMASFWPIGTVLGTGQKAQKMAGFMDDVGETIRHWEIPGTGVRPVGDIANLFNARAGGATNRSLLQLSGKTIDDKARAVAGVREKVAFLAHERKRLGISEADIDKWLDYPGQAPAHAQPLVAEHLKLYYDLPREMQEWGSARKDVNPQMAWAGSDVRYKPRALVDNLVDRPGGKSKQYSGHTESDLGREDWTKGVRGGDAVLREMAKETGRLKKLGMDPHQISIELEQKFGNNFEPQFFPGEQVNAILKSKKYRGLDLAGALQLASQGQKVKVGGKVLKPKDTFLEAAQHLSSMSDEALEAGVWGNDPLFDIEQRMTQDYGAFEVMKNTLGFLSEKYKTDPNSFLPQPGSISMRELLSGDKAKHVRGLGMTAGDNRAGAAKKFYELTQGLDISTLPVKQAKKLISEFKQLHVDPETAKHLLSVSEGVTGPESVNKMLRLWDSLTAFTKALFTTGDWVRFNTRNLPGGVFNNAMVKQASMEGMKAAFDMATSGVVKGAMNLPIVQQIAKQRGIVLADDKAATNILAELAYAHEVTAHAGTGNPTHAQHLGGKLDDILSEIPGNKPFTASGLGQTLAGRKGEWNPKNWRVRGVLGAEETTMPWMRAGEQVGDFTEHMIRFSGFYTLLKQGVDPAEAALRIGEAQARYQNRFYTKFEQDTMQRLLLFYKFSKAQLPFMIRQLAEEPGGRLSKVLRAINRFRSDDENVPDWIKETTSIPVGQQEDGTKRYITGLGLPFEDPVQFASPSAQNLLMEGASRLNPLIKGPLEYMTGQSFFQKGGPHGGRPLEDLDPVLGRTLSNIGQLTGLRDSQAPIRYPGSGAIEHVLSNSPLSPFLTKARTLTDPRKGIGAKASNLLTGLKMTDVSPGTQDNELRRKIQRIEKELGAKTYLQTYIPKEVASELSPAERAQAEQLAALKKLLQDRSKERKKGPKK